MSKLCIEHGIIVSKEIVSATAEKVYNGKTTPAKPEQYKITTLSGADYDNEYGYINPTMVNYYVDKTMFGLMDNGAKVKVKYNYGMGDKGEFKSPVSIELAK